MNFNSFKQFWPFYLDQHKNKTNQILHLIGSGLGGTWFFAFFIVPEFVLLTPIPWPWQGIGAIVPALIIGYSFAWTGHFVFEKNRPATFRWPLYSFIADWKMIFLMLSRKKYN
jgi:hypothetical protein